MGILNALLDVLGLLVVGLGTLLMILLFMSISEFVLSLFSTKENPFVTSVRSYSWMILFCIWLVLSVIGFFHVLIKRISGLSQLRSVRSMVLLPLKSATGSFAVYLTLLSLLGIYNKSLTLHQLMWPIAPMIALFFACSASLHFIPNRLIGLLAATVHTPITLLHRAQIARSLTHALRDAGLDVKDMQLLRSERYPEEYDRYAPVHEFHDLKPNHRYVLCLTATLHDMSVKFMTTFDIDENKHVVTADEGPVMEIQENLVDTERQGRLSDDLETSKMLLQKLIVRLLEMIMRTMSS